MQLNFYFVKNKKNYYSFPPLIASLSKLSCTKTAFVSPDSLANYQGSTNQRDVFCFSYNSVAFRKDINFLKKCLPILKGRGALVIVGGPHATAKPDDFLSLGFDCVVRGDGEIAIIKVAEALKEQLPLKNIVEYKLQSLNDFPPFPDDKTFYKPIEITRGCPYGCNYCQTSFIFNRKPLHRSIENIIFYVKKAFSWGIRDFRFISPNALGYGTYGNKPEAAHLFSLLSSIRSVIKREGRLFFGSFPSEIRPEFATKEVMQILKEFVDNKRVIMGAQTASQRMLKLSGRGHSVADIETAIENSLEAGFQIDIDLIAGMPGETDEDIKETIGFIKKYATKNVRFHLHYFIPLPGSPWENQKPTPISSSALKEFKRLTGLGKIWGLWLSQKSYTKL